MAISYHIDPARRRVTNIARGAITGEDLIAAQGATAADPRFDPGYDQLLDLREAVLHDIPAATIAHLAAGSAYRPTSRRAVLVTDLHAFGLVRMFRGRAAERRGQIELFSDVAAAEAWLESSNAAGRTEIPAAAARRASYTEVVDETAVWILVEEIRPPTAPDSARPFRVAYGFGTVPPIVEPSAVLVDHQGRVRWFASAETARSSALEAAQTDRRHH